jgi:hypothetical protein
MINILSFFKMYKKYIAKRRIIPKKACFIIEKRCFLLAKIGGGDK